MPQISAVTPTRIVLMSTRNSTLTFGVRAADGDGVDLPKMATDDLDLRLDRLRRAMLHRCAASGRVPPATLERLTSVLPAWPPDEVRRTAGASRDRAGLRRSVRSPPR